MKTLIETEIIVPIERSQKINPKQRRSALLFGPPGTSKTSIARAVARRLSWPWIEINPSHFLSDGLEKIYVRADEVFADLMDLENVVVLFDEMDALVQSRGSDQTHQRLDITRQFLTTSMLPKLAKLQSRGRIVFFMATNHQKEFDDAIKRPGRFDLLICVGPPNWAEKVRRIEKFLPSKSLEDPARIRSLLLAWIGNNDKVYPILNQFTYAEMKSFFEHLRRRSGEETLLSALEQIGAAGFRKLVEEWGTSFITLRPKMNNKSNPLLGEFEHDKDVSRRQ